MVRYICVAVLLLLCILHIAECFPKLNEASIQKWRKAEGAHLRVERRARGGRGQGRRRGNQGQSRGTESDEEQENLRVERRSGGNRGQVRRGGNQGRFPGSESNEEQEKSARSGPLVPGTGRRRNNRRGGRPGQGRGPQAPANGRHGSRQSNAGGRGGMESGPGFFQRHGQRGEPLASRPGKCNSESDETEDSISDDNTDSTSDNSDNAGGDNTVNDDNGGNTGDDAIDDTTNTGDDGTVNTGDDTDTTGGDSTDNSNTGTAGDGGVDNGDNGGSVDNTGESDNTGDVVDSGSTPSYTPGPVGSIDTDQCVINGGAISKDEIVCSQLLQSGVWYSPYNGDCTKFCQCGSDKESPHVQLCAPGTAWDDDLMTCTAEKLAACKSR